MNKQFCPIFFIFGIRNFLMMNYSVYLYLFLFLTTSSLEAQKSEYHYIKEIQDLLGGDLEISVIDGRADLVTSTYAIEVEFAEKWKESIGQATWYGLQLNKTPGIVLILRQEKDYKYYQQLNSTLEAISPSHGIKTWVYPNDFKKSDSNISKQNIPSTSSKDSSIKHEIYIQFLTSRYSAKTFPELNNFGRVISIKGIVTTKYILITQNPNEAFRVLIRLGFKDAFVRKNGVENLSSTSSSSVYSKSTSIAPTTSPIRYEKKSPRKTYRYSSARRYIQGPRGGCYYINKNGNKTYVSRSYCN